MLPLRGGNYARITVYSFAAFSPTKGLSGIRSTTSSHPCNRRGGASRQPRSLRFRLARELGRTQMYMRPVALRLPEHDASVLRRICSRFGHVCRLLELCLMDVPRQTSR